MSGDLKKTNLKNSYKLEHTSINVCFELNMFQINQGPVLN